MVRENLWKIYDEKHLEELERVNKQYRECLDAGKTERECVRETIRLGGSPISFQDKASGGLQRCADVLYHAKHDAHLAASTPRCT